MLIAFIISGLVFGTVCAVLADRWGHSALAWFGLGFLIQLIAILLLTWFELMARSSERRHRESVSGKLADERVARFDAAAKLRAAADALERQS